jgi:hypothetical protein
MGRAAYGDGDWAMATEGCWAGLRAGPRARAAKLSERTRWATTHWVVSCGVGLAWLGNGSGVARSTRVGIAAREAGEGQNGGGGSSPANDGGWCVVAEPRTVTGSGGFTQTTSSLGPTGDARQGRQLRTAASRSGGETLGQRALGS